MTLTKDNPAFAKNADGSFVDHDAAMAEIHRIAEELAIPASEVLNQIHMAAQSIAVGEISDDIPEMSDEPSIAEQFRFAVTLYALTLLPHNRDSRAHWNEIVDGLYLGAIPIETMLGKHGNHGEKLIRQCSTKGRPLSLVLSVLQKWELEGRGTVLTPVNPEYWRSQGIEQELVEVQDFTGEISPDKLQAILEKMHKKIEAGESVYVHCKAGRGRSFLVVMCYLMQYHGMSVNEALKTIYEKRSQVSPSMRQFEAIERYRKAKCPDAEPLNPDSDIFKPFRKDTGAYLTHEYTQGALAFVMLLGVFGTGMFALPFAAVGGVMASIACRSYKSEKDIAAKESAKELEADDGSTFTTDQRLAFQYGYFAAQSWAAWGEACVRPVAYQHTRHYDAGFEAGKEHDEAKLEKFGYTY